MQRNAAGLLAMLGLVGGAAFAGPIYIDSSGREWLDVNDTRYRSWDDTSAICSVTTGDCSGVLASNGSSSDIDLTGYTWASRDDVRELFYEVAGLPAGSLDSYSASSPIGAGYGANAFGVLEPTIQFDWGPAFENILNGLTRGTYVGSDGLVHGISGIIDSPPFGSDHFTLDGGLATNIREISQGVYLYKAVPEPGTLALFALGLFGVLVTARTRFRRPV
jgi:hypothetical protein